MEKINCGVDALSERQTADVVILIVRMILIDVHLMIVGIPIHTDL